MNDYTVLIGVCSDTALQDEANRALEDRRWAIHKMLFSLGPAWSGNQTAVLLRSNLSREAIVAQVSPLLEPGDFVLVLEGRATSATSIGWNADEEGLNAIYPEALKVPDAY